MARELLQADQLGRAKDEAQKAIEDLKAALRNPEDLEHGEYLTHSQCFRSIVLTYETLVLIANAERNDLARQTAMREIAKNVNRWLQEHPLDSYAVYEPQRLYSRWPEVETLQVTAT